MKNNYNPFMVEDGYYWFRFDALTTEVVKVSGGKMFRIDKGNFQLLTRAYGKILEKVEPPKE